MIRIATSLLEQFRRMVEFDYIPESQIIDSVMGKEAGATWQMRAGTAWHTVLADPEPLATMHEGMPGFALDGYFFHKQAVVEAREVLGRGVWEVKALKTLDVYGCPVVLVAKADHVHGNMVTDVKTRWGNPIDASSYEPDLQWRAYLLAHAATVFRYVFCEFREPEIPMRNSEPSYCELRHLSTTRFFPYPDMEQDVVRWVSRFLDYCHTRKLTSYLHRDSREKVLTTSGTPE